MPKIVKDKVQVIEIAIVIYTAVKIERKRNKKYATI